ncbi:MAG: hypothetical protein ACOYK6_05130 [Chthoniobacterales bacterium]
MMKTLLLLLISCLVALNTSHGQTPATPAATYPIPPVYCYEYYGFLHDIQAPQNETNLEDVEEKFIGNNILILVSGSPGKCTFIPYLDKSHPPSSTQQVESIYKDDIWRKSVINAVPSQEAQTAFNTWQENPTETELFNYLDDQIKVLSAYHGGASPTVQSKCKADAVQIKSRYPRAPLYPPVTGVTVFDEADYIAQNYKRTDVYIFVNELNDPLVTIPGTHMLDLQASLERSSSYTNQKGEVVMIGPPYLVRRVIAIEKD